MSIYNQAFFEDLSRAEGENWWYKGREKFIVKILQNTFQDKSKRRQILDLGCGTGRMMEVLGRFGDVIGADVSVDALKFCQAKGFESKKIDAQKTLPFRDQTFDLVTAFDLLEHLENDKKVLTEVNRILKPKGFFLMTSPALPILWSKHDESFGHKRRYFKKDLAIKIRQANLEIIRLKYFNFFLAPLIFGVGRLQNIYFKKGPRSHILKLPSLLNRLVSQIAIFDGTLALKLSFPLGSSLACLAQRSGEK